MNQVAQFSCGYKQIIYSLGEKIMSNSFCLSGDFCINILSLSDGKNFFSHLKCQNFYIDLSNDYGKFRVEIKQRLSNDYQNLKNGQLVFNLVRCL